MKRLQEIRDFAWFQRLYVVTIVIKGFDGLVELLAGLSLLVAPGLLHHVLSYLFGRANVSHGHFMYFVAENIARIDSDLAKGGLSVVILFLVTHGVVKLALVYALLRKLLWAYPYALVVLGLFFLYQLYLCVVQPTVGMFLFTLLDALIIWIVWGEWQKLKDEKDSAKAKDGV